MNSHLHRFVLTAAIITFCSGVQTLGVAQPNAPSSNEAQPKSAAKAADSPLDQKQKPPGGDHFYYSDGRLDDFIHAVQRHFGFKWDVVTIPPEMQRVRVPKLRVKTDNVSDLQKIVNLYNFLGEKRPELGEWVLVGAPEKPDLVMVVPNRKTEGQPSFFTKAIALREIPQENWRQVEVDIVRAADGVSHRFGLGLDGNVDFHKESRFLLVSGTKAFVDLAESIVAAHLENARVKLESPEPDKGAR
jgi:hypothetical protein